MNTILLEKKIDGHEGVAVITYNRPESLNALNTQMATEIIDAFHQLEQDETIRALVITGTGTKSFCVGADLKERNRMTPKKWKEQHRLFEAVTEKIRDFPFPVIASINGYALGGGMEMALSCDFRVASTNAVLGLPEAKLGLIPGIGGTQLIARSIPVGIAKELLFTGNHIDALYAKEIGLVNHIFPQEELLQETLKIASNIARNAPLSLQALKKTINQGSHLDLSTAFSLDLAYYYQCANSEDRIEGIAAFNEKRKANWKGL